MFALCLTQFLTVFSWNIHSSGEERQINRLTINKQGQCDDEIRIVFSGIIKDDTPYHYDSVQMLPPWREDVRGEHSRLRTLGKNNSLSQNETMWGRVASTGKSSSWCGLILHIPTCLVKRKFLL